MTKETKTVLLVQLGEYVKGVFTPTSPISSIEDFSDRSEFVSFYLNDNPNEFGLSIVGPDREVPTVVITAGRIASPSKFESRSTLWHSEVMEFPATNFVIIRRAGIDTDKAIRMGYSLPELPDARKKQS